MRKTTLFAVVAALPAERQRKCRRERSQWPIPDGRP